VLEKLLILIVMSYSLLLLFRIAPDRKIEICRKVNGLYHLGNLHLSPPPAVDFELSSFYFCHPRLGHISSFCLKTLSDFSV